MIRTAREQIYGHERASKLFTPLAFDAERKLFQLDDQSLGFAFLCNPLSGADQSTAEKMNVLLNQDYPKGTMLSVSLFGSPDLEPLLIRMESLREKHKKDTELFDLLWDTTRNNSNFFRGGVRDPIESRSGIRVRDMLNIVTVKVPISSMEPGKKEYEHAASLQRSTKQALDTIGFGGIPLDASSYVRLMHTLISWGDNPRWRSEWELYDQDDILNEQIVDLDHYIGFDKHGVKLGDPDEPERYARVKLLSPKRYPKEWHIGMVGHYLGDLRTGTRGIRHNFLLNYNVFYPDAENLRSKKESERQWITNQAYGPIAKFRPRLVEQKEDYEVLFQAIEDGDRPIQVSMCLALFAKNDEDADMAVSAAKTYFRELNYQLLEDKYFPQPIFMNNMPFGADRDAVFDMQRYKTMGTRHACHLLPIVSDWKGTKTPMLNFVSRNGQIMSFDLFDSDTSFNCTIAAQSGSGKSVLTNAMITAYLATGAHIWVIDVGRSYQKLCNMYNGEFMEFSETSQICLNPFSIVQNYDEESDMLVDVLGAMAAPTEKMSDYQRSGLRRVLRDCWDKHGKNLSIDLIADALKLDKDQRVQDLGEQLFAFTTRGEYGRWFNGENNMQFSNPFTVLELEELKGRKHLQQIVLLMLMYQIQHAMYLGDRSVRKVVCIDEAWDLLAQGDVGKFIETGYRRARKYNGLFTVITQSVLDLYNTPTGVSIAENSPNMILLGQRAETINTLKETGHVDLNEGGFEILKTVKTMKGAYSELFFICDSGMGIGRLYLDRYQQLLFTTDADEVAEINRRIDMGITVKNAIESMIYEEQQREAA